MQLKCMQEKKCSQAGKEIPVYDSLLCPFPRLVSSSNKSLHRSNASRMSHACFNSSIVFLACSVQKYLSSTVMSWMEAEDALVCPVWGKVMLVEKVNGDVVDDEGNGMGLLCYSCLFTCGKRLRAVLANCLFWWKKGSAPGSSGSELLLSKQIAGLHAECG